MNTIRRNLYNFFSVFLKKKDNYKGKMITFASYNFLKWTNVGL